MKVAIVQFSPRLGDREFNKARTWSLLREDRREYRRGGGGGLDLIVLPEMALTGYNFPNVNAILPYLESGPHGPSAEWAMELALTYRCHVCIGYPETAVTGNYNSQVIVSPDRRVVHHYRKSHLYYTDEIWAQEGDGFKVVDLPFSPRVVTGICMDINPYKFMAPATDYEFANFCVQNSARLVVLSMAWTPQLPEGELSIAYKPHFPTLKYWLERLLPYFESPPLENTIVIIANRCGTEPGVPGNFLAINDRGDVGYAGTSCVLKFGPDTPGRACLYDAVGRGEETVLFVNTDTAPKCFIDSDHAIRAAGNPDEITT